MSSNLETGALGEDLAVSSLTEQGWEILDRNWRGKGGELDVVGLDGTVLVAVEVKTRSSLAYGAPALAVTEQKINRLKRLFGQWMVDHRGQVPPIEAVRIDVVSVLLNRPDGDAAVPVIEHLKGVS